ncbi:hypothetical protein HPB47_026721, partial [Ixodes persulcatus]
HNKDRGFRAREASVAGGGAEWLDHVTKAWQTRHDRALQPSRAPELRTALSASQQEAKKTLTDATDATATYARATGPGVGAARDRRDCEQERTDRSGIDGQCGLTACRDWRPRSINRTTQHLTAVKSKD